MAILSLLMVLSMLLGMPGVRPALAANPPPEQIFYVTLPEGDALSFFQSVNTLGGGFPPSARPVSTYFSIAVVLTDTYVYYDQWENGYAADIANPTASEIYDSATNPGGVQIWGNQLAADGCPPNKAGVALTCTNANDRLYAGDVIVPYNDVDVAMYNVWDWFNTVAYNNNNGTTNNWAGSWTESGDDGVPGTGDIMITGNQLRFMATEANDSIRRGVAMPTGAGCATVSFDLDAPSQPDGNLAEEFSVEVDDDGGASWTTLWTFDTDNTNDERHRWGFNLAAGDVSANTVIRFLSVDTLGASESWTVDNVKVMWGCGNNANNVVFDAKDKIAASNAIAMAKANWAAGASTLLAFAHEIYSTSEWGTAYEAPVGQNTAAPGTSMFQFSALSIMASKNNTSVQIDADANGIYETTTTLNEGGSYYATGIQRGARVQSDKPIQVLLLTGDTGDTYEARDMTLLPTSAYGTSLWAASGRTGPAGEARVTTLWLYNPTVNGSNIYITCERNGVANVTSGSIAARGTYAIDVTDGQGAHCYASNSSGVIDNTKVIFGIGAIDAMPGDGGGQDGSRSDWGYTLYPDNFLTTEALVGLGLGRDPLATVTLNENSSPLWVTAACSTGNTYVYVDWNNDGTADLVDLNGDGDTTDNNVDGIANLDEPGTSNGLQVVRLQSVRLFEPPLDTEFFDQTAARVWSRTASGVGYGGTAGCNLALAWGQDLDTSSAAIPALDSGTSVPPLRLVTGSKGLTLKTDNDGDGQLSVGDVATYNMSIVNNGPASVTNIHVYDVEPANTSYIENTTQSSTNGTTWSAVGQPDSGVLPLSVSGGYGFGNLASGATLYVRFDVLLEPDGDYEEIENCVEVTSGAGTFDRCVTSLVATKDWGDLPDSYRTSAAANGPRHSDNGLRLGSLWDANVQGVPTVGADGDDLQYQDDEDGVALSGTGAGWNSGSGVVSVSASGPGCLNAWMDFTDDVGTSAGVNFADGNFTKTGGYDTFGAISEYIIQNVKINAGTTSQSVTVPSNLFTPSTNNYYFRFRLSPTSDGTYNGTCTATIPPFGPVAGGEVEDYRFNLNLATIGDYVWVDEDGNGLQDAGEPGIPNVTVSLYQPGPDGLFGTGDDVLVGTTTTDANGGYMFTDRMPGAYRVVVNPATLPPELAANPTYDEDGIATAHASIVSLTPGEEHMTADFGYNYSSPCETNTPGATGCPTPTGAIGDRLWVDTDGDGKQDAAEIGIQGVTVNLFGPGPDGIFDPGPDGLYGTPDDDSGAPVATDSTDANGNYIFDGLSAGGYVVQVNAATLPAGYTQTGDPDHFAASGGVNDNQTTTPIVLAPGDVFLNADFGYQPTTAQVGSIGDYVWFDADADTVQDGAEYGIKGVTVSLIKDTNGNGTWEAGEPIIATTITGDNPATPGTVETGWYQFTGLPASGTEDYLVWVNDTSNVLGDLVPTYDNNGIATPNISAAANLTTAGNANQDFGYTAPNYTTGEGLIGDFIWLDKNGNGVQDAGEPGLEGVAVRLLDSSGNLLAVTTTDENGRYYFGDLVVSAGGVTYQVQVVPASLPAGLTQTYDADGTGTANVSTVTLTTAAPIALNQDFGYQGTNTIGGTIWTDTNADGTLSGESGRFQGVTVVLKDANGDIVATTTTDLNGDYSFNNLPNGTFTVDVTDDANVLNGYWKSTGPSAGSDNNSQVDPYTVTVTGGQTNNTADFGYYLQPAAVGNFVWEDLDQDGIQDGGETGIAGVPVTLTITWPNSAGTTILQTTTDANGAYSFGNLLQDEDYPASGGTGQPAFSISVATPSGYTPSPQNQTTENLDSDSGAGEAAIATKGSTNDTYDFGFFRPPAVIGNKVWLDENGDGVQDPGEAGIPNVTVQLWNAGHTAVVATTTTDADGNYIFKNLTPATYQVDVLNSTLPDPDGAGPGGLVQTTPTGTGDFTNKADPYTVTVTGGSENLTADFGYNWAPSSDVDGNTNTGAIGDRVWIDADGDGVQDPEELGLPGVTVQLWYDSNNDGVIDTQYGSSATTNATGNYIFDSLPKGLYEVRLTAGTTGYTQTGDPDLPGAACGGACDAKTTTPILLGPGDVFVNADFGYQPNTGVGASIGNRLWFDADADQVGPTDTPGGGDTSETGIPGVTVALIKDTNADGAWDPDGVDNVLGTADDEVILATDITDAAGYYLFGGVPVTDGVGTDDYLVWVNDTDNVLGSLVPTYDSNGTASANLSAVANLSPANNLLQDFGYSVKGQAPGDGLIGDTIFLDRDGGLDFDPGEGLEGVVVRLYSDTNADGNYDSGEPLLDATVTDENGKYYFANLPAGNYVVMVDTTTLPGGLTNTVDPDTTNSPVNESGVTLAAGGIDLAQDFGYDGAGSIGNLVWNDADADGFKDAGETGLDGVTVDLYWDRNANGVLDPADMLAGSTTTAGGGAYSFNNLGVDDGGGNMAYFVHVTDTANLLNGYWHSLGTAGTNDYSQADPYLVTLTTGVPTNTTADFGYYLKPAVLGNFVWEDLDQDGIQDGGEPGIAGVEVTLTITWPGAGGTTTVKTTTDANGAYSFGNLLQDEDYPASGGAGQPVLSISVATPSGYTPSPQNQTTEDLDSDNGAGEAAIATKGSTNNTYDFGFFRPPAVIGNKVWLDENGDGVQDPGEAGIPNVTVQLWNAGHTAVVATTTTDADGNYIFKGLTPGTYQVDVLNSTLPAGLVQTTPTGTGDFTNKADPYTVTVTGGSENLTADFGYNWAPSTDVDNNTNTGAIGDRVWIDADGDGVQDPEELGLPGVTVQLWYDSNNDGVIDTQYGSSATTNATGNYIFDNLPNGIYEVRLTAGTTGYTQTGDPDLPGAACGGACDAKTTTPILLGPGDVFVNADFGYQPNTGVGASIGNRLWFDADADQVGPTDTPGGGDTSETGIPGVTVALIKDTNADGAWDPDGVDNVLGTADDEVILATDITDAAGYYLFSGVPVTDGVGTDDYLVWVNDTDNVLGSLVPTYDSNSTASANLSAVADLTIANDLLQDFGYSVKGQAPGDGMIGDTIFLDRDGGLDFDPGEGLEGVLVRLYSDTNADGNYDSGEPLLDATLTDENGKYYFANLPAGNYVVMVDITTLPGGLTNTVDPDTTNSPVNESGVTLAAGGIDLAQDFGYDGAGSIGNLIWNDADADGFKDAGETGLDGVTVDLYWDSNANGVLDAADKLVGSTVTAGGGAYSFNNLGVDDGGGNMAYFVHVTDTANLLNGYWHSLGTAGTNDYSQADPYLVTLTTGAPTNTTADFGYYVQPTGLGNWVWVDENKNGIQDAGEAGIANVAVTLTIAWPNGSTTTLTTTTDANGYYSFGNLLLDEDYDAVGGGEPTFTLTVPIPANYTASPVDATTDDLDSDGVVSGSNVQVVVGSGINSPLWKGHTNLEYDFGFAPSPTSITVSQPEASAVNNTIFVKWTSSSELDILSFNLYRGSAPVGEPVYHEEAKFKGKLAGAEYTYPDTDVQPDVSYTYWLEVLLKDGTAVVLEPTTASIQTPAPFRIYLPTVLR